MLKISRGYYTTAFFIESLLIFHAVIFLEAMYPYKVLLTVIFLKHTYLFYQAGFTF